ncbi:MAG TPA: plastocyanin/azurin family copper-binding protein [Nitrososphaeraceae archaeon]|jgi:plastocyanin|nr:plastocyanin/azurin family copper-binding protein [Nitrososphaeraceae archaeon]
MAFVVSVAISVAYYQFVYIPQANQIPVVPEEVLNPMESVEIAISVGSSQPSQTENFVPKQVQGELGLSNKFVWTNDDSVPHTVTSDTGYVDPVNGAFNSMDTIGLIPANEKYEFTFTEAGEYPYHCEPHPWMTGKVTVSEGRF